MSKRTTYPFLNLREAIDRTADLREKLGNGPFKVAAALEALGYKGPSGTSNRTFASLNHYGLLGRRAGGYELTPRAIQIVRPTSEESKKIAIVEAAQQPKLFSELIALFSGQALPPMLDNYLIHNFDMTDTAAKKASTVFKKAVKFAGLLGDDGVLGSDTSGPADDGVIVEQSNTVLPGNSNVSTAKTGAAGDVKELPSGIRIAFPATLDFAVLTGEFGEEIKKLEEKARKVMASINEGKSPDDDEKAGSS